MSRRWMVVAVLIGGLWGAGQAAARESLFTTLDTGRCRKLPSGPELTIDWQFECPGAGGYRLVIDDADDRMSLIVIEPNGRRTPLRFRELISNFFSELGVRAEWRVERVGETIVPTALIVRFNAAGYVNEDDLPIEGDVSYLTVTRIKPGDICLTHVLPTTEPGADELARRLADRNADAPCYPVTQEQMAALVSGENPAARAGDAGAPFKVDVEPSRLTAEEEEMLQSIQRADPSLRYSREVLRYSRADADTGARTPFLVESRFPRVDGLILGEYIAYSVSFEPDSRVVRYSFNAGHAFYGEITAVVSDRVRMIRVECGTDGCRTSVQ